MPGIAERYCYGLCPSDSFMLEAGTNRRMIWNQLVSRLVTKKGASERVAAGPAAPRRSRIWFGAALLLLVTSGCGGGDDANGSGGSGGTSGNSNAGTGGGAEEVSKFSFFVISLESVRSLSGSQDGFGGDLRFGETGAGAGLRGADKICAQAAEIGLKGAGAKEWRAFLSATAGENGPVDAKDRVGAGPWYDQGGRLVASTLTELLMDRPGDADPTIKNDLPNEFGIPNHMDGAVGCSADSCPNNHQVLTGTGADGQLYTATTPASDATCNDWTSSEASGKPRTGHSWPRTGSGTNWISAENGNGCAPCVLADQGSGAKCVGATGGYGGFYCFALLATP